MRRSRYANARPLAAPPRSPSALAAQLNQTDARRDTGSKLVRLKLAKKLRLGQRFVRTRVD